MSYVAETPSARRTWLARRDPRLKLLWLGFVSLASVLLDSRAALAALAVATLLVALGHRWRGRTWLFVGGIVAAIVWGTVLSQAMFFRAEPPRPPLLVLVPEFTLLHLTFPGLALHAEGAAYGLLQSLRIAAVALTGLTICLSTSTERLLAALVALRVPAAISFMAVAALRFLPTLAEQWSAVRAASRLRGYRPRLAHPGPAGWASWRMEVALLVPIVAAALRRAQTLATALTARGFDATMPRTAFPPLTMTAAERALVVLVAAAGVALSAVKSLAWLAVGGLYRLPLLETLYRWAGEWL